ncbi:dihydropteroate synthase [Sphingomonas glaciei]|uniref:dihydropteroate synthase n=1 Tax=Sphingomonas glaciei TaxID=2938948 RepID=A0ABY5MWX4_9SPHN|nr:dihydropteroate synthase [Sphingomonas glaciei]UUR08617.1 dihydropteroate synthase [Sphingomonas glaciei]
MALRTILRPTAFVDAPFGYDGQVARLAGTMCWFSAVELLKVGHDGQVSAELVPVEQIEARLDDDAMAADWASLTAVRPPLRLGERTIRLDQPQLMAILNATPDSFSGGGQAASADDGFAAAEAGAAILDVGGESTRPGARQVWEGDEIERVLPLVQRLAAGGAAVSIDTRKAAVMEAAIGAGATLVNDVSALGWDQRSAEVVAKAGVPVVLMHHQGSPETMQEAPSYPRGALVEVFFWLEDRIAAAVDAGIARDRIIVDPGIGFGKSVAHNLELMNGLTAFHALGCPLLVGASRKRTIGALHNEAPADRRLSGSVTLAIKAAEQGAHLIRAHDVFENVQALRVWRGLRDQALTPRF